MRSGRRRRWCCPDALRSDVVRPGKCQRDRKAEEQHGDHQTQRPVRQFPRWKCSRRQLYRASRSDDVGRRHAVHPAPFHFFKEAAAHNTRFGSSGIIFNGEEIDTKMHIAGSVPVDSGYRQRRRKPR